MHLSLVDQALAEEFAGPTPFTVAINRGAAEAVAAPTSMDAVVAAIDAGAARVEARPDPERDAWAERQNRRAMQLQLRTAGTDNLLVRS